MVVATRTQTCLAACLSGSSRNLTATVCRANSCCASMLHDTYVCRAGLPSCLSGACTARAQMFRLIVLTAALLHAADVKCIRMIPPEFA